MRIGIYHPRVGTARSGGTETLIRGLIEEVSNSYDHDVVLYTGVGELLGEIEEAPITVEQVKYVSRKNTFVQTLCSRFGLPPFWVESMSMYYFGRRQGVFRHIEENVDVVATFYELDNVLVSRSVGTPSVFHLAGTSDVTNVHLELMDKFSKNDLLLVSNGVTKRDVEQLGIAVDGIVYPNVDTNRFSPEAEPAIDDDRVVVLYVGRFTRVKGLEDLLAACRLVDGEIALYLVGDGPLKTKLRRLVREYELRESVTFVDPVPHEKIHHYFASCDVFCLPSYSEGFPTVNLEAASCGKPIVSTTLEPIAEQVEDGETGYLVDPGDVDAMASRLHTLANDPEKRTAFGRKARAKAKAFSREAQVAKMVEFLEGVRTERLTGVD